MITEQAIRSTLIHNNLNILLFDVIDSTNSGAKQIAKECADGFVPTLLVAKEQTAGRGRMGRRFFSRRDGGIFMTLLYPSTEPLESAVSITTAAAAVVAQAIESVTGRDMKIKWVNDIYDGQGKVSGILAETVSVGSRLAVIVGIGINTGISDFPEEIKGIASSVGELYGREGELIAKITDGLLTCAENPKDRSYMSAYRERFMLTDKIVDLMVGGEGRGCGRVVGVNDSGELLIIPEGQTCVTVIQSGEVSVREKKIE